MIGLLGSRKQNAKSLDNDSRVFLEGGCLLPLEVFSLPHPRLTISIVQKIPEFRTESTYQLAIGSRLARF